MPPPAVGFHHDCRLDKSVGNFGEILRFKVVTEYESTGADPTQIEVLGTQIILEHPIVSARLEVQGRPN